MDRSARFATGGTEEVFEALLKSRAKRREESGAHERENTDQAILPTCEDMCPEFERLERELHLDVHPIEARIMDGELTKIDHQKAVKKYHRPAAGNDAPLPEDIRTPQALLRTLAYLFNDILNSTEYFFSEIHAFVRDRTRSIRQDLTLQNCRNSTSILIHEQIARFHILSGFVMAEASPSEFDTFQNMEQLRKVLQSLHEMYGDAHARAKASGQSISFEGEAEMRSYYILCHVEDVNVFNVVSSLTDSVFESGNVKFALQVAKSFHQGHYVKYGMLMRQADFMQAALMLVHLVNVRLNALEIMSKSYSTSELFPLNDLMRILMFEEPVEFTEFLSACSVEFNERGAKLANLIRPEEQVKARKLLSIDAKMVGMKYSELVCFPTKRPKGIDVSEVIALKKKLCFDMCEALIAFGVENLVSDIVVQIWNGKVIEFRKRITDFKRHLCTALSERFFSQALSELLSELAAHSLDSYLQTQFDDRIANLKKDFVDQCFAKLCNFVIFEELDNLSREVMADQLRDRSIKILYYNIWVYQSRSKLIRMRLQQNYQNRISSERKALNSLLSIPFKQFKVKPKINIDRHIFKDVLVWSLASEFDLYSPSGQVRVHCERSIGRCPHMIIYDDENLEYAKSIIYQFKIPWSVYIVPANELQCTRLLENNIAELENINAEKILSDRVQLLTCGAMYKKRLQRFILSAVYYLNFQDPARIFHPNKEINGIYRPSFMKVEQQFNDMVIGVDSIIATPMPHRKRTKSIDRKFSHLQKALYEVKKENNRFEKTLLAAIERNKL